MTKIQEQKRGLCIKDRLCLKKLLTGEAHFSLDRQDKFMNWQLENEINHYNRVKRPFDGGGVMVHGVLGREGSLKLTHLKGTINSEKYIALLNKSHVITLNWLKHSPDLSHIKCVC